MGYPFILIWIVVAILSVFWIHVLRIHYTAWKNRRELKIYMGIIGRSLKINL